MGSRLFVDLQLLVCYNISVSIVFPAKKTKCLNINFYDFYRKNLSIILLTLLKIIRQIEIIKHKQFLIFLVWLVKSTVRFEIIFYKRISLFWVPFLDPRKVNFFLFLIKHSYVWLKWIFFISSILSLPPLPTKF